jgi:hypothetical protein
MIAGASASAERASFGEDQIRQDQAVRSGVPRHGQKDAGLRRRDIKKWQTSVSSLSIGEMLKPRWAWTRPTQPRVRAA